MEYYGKQIASPNLTFEHTDFKGLKGALIECLKGFDISLAKTEGSIIQFGIVPAFAPRKCFAIVHDGIGVVGGYGNTTRMTQTMDPTIGIFMFLLMHQPYRMAKLMQGCIQHQVMLPLLL